MRLSTILFCIVMLSLPTVARADDATVRAENTTSTVRCTNEPAVVNGGRNNINFTGSCKGLQVRGEANNITVALAAGSLIDIEGNGNSVAFTATGAPRLKVSGSHTQVLPKPGVPAPAADTAVLNGDDLDVALDCHGKAVTLQGVRSHYHLSGACAALTVKGEANTVQVEFAANAQVLVEGNGITLTYTVARNGAPPAITVRGMGSSALRAGSAVAAPTAPVVANTVVASVPMLMNQLDGIVINTGTIVKLPVAVFGDDGVTPAGETQLARLNALIAQINPAGLRIVGHDPTDPALAGKRADLVKGWLASHAGKPLPVQQSTDIGAAGVDVLMLRQP